MIAVILALIIGAVFGAFAVIVTAIAIADRDKEKGKRWWEE